MRLVTAQDASQVAAAFHEYGIQHLITPMPSDSPFVVVRQFVNEWTAPSGASCGGFELRNVLPAKIEKPREVGPAGPGVYDDLDSRIEYTGAWLHDRQFKQPQSGSITYSRTAGDSFRLFFSGTAVEYVFTRAPNRGIAEVWIDGKRRAELDEYSPAIEWRTRRIFARLPEGPHTIEVHVTGKKNAASADVYVDVDAVVIR